MGDTVVQIGTVGTTSAMMSDPEAPAKDKDQEALEFWRGVEGRVALRTAISYRRPNNRQERRRR